ncbi:MAG: GGDEF domain-containing protein [Ruminococcus sp.]|nr:GGDEF domain-containing protein [Ruminococcus sp.]
MIKKMLERARDTMLYAGLEREQYNAIKADITQENTSLLRFASLVGMVMFLFLMIMELRTDNFANVNAYNYTLSFVAMVGIHLCVRFLCTKQEWLVLPLIYLFMVVLNVYSVSLSMLHPEYPAVSAEVFLVVVPLVFIDKPLRLLFLTVLSGVTICVFSVMMKDRVFADVDIWNTISFTALAVIANTLLMRMKATSIYRNKRIAYLSETDLLTEVKNRNCFESRLASYPGMCRSGLVCVYADINGLHDLNNSKGHEAGDTMLRFVASELRDFFGGEHTYRLGGDEFLGVRVDDTEQGTREAVERIRERCLAEGYHVSFGISDCAKDDGDLNSAVKRAEELMYREKKAFYGENARM